jgi:hypothetical protein
VVACGLDAGASAAFNVTRTVSLLSGMLMVRWEGRSALVFNGTAPVFRGGRTAPVCLETGMLDVGGFTTAGAATGGRTGCFIKGMLPVCLDGMGAAACFKRGTLAVCLEGIAGASGFDGGVSAGRLGGRAPPTWRRSGTLVVNFDGGAGVIGGVGGCVSGSLMRVGILL